MWRLVNRCADSSSPFCWAKASEGEVGEEALTHWSDPSVLLTGLIAIFTLVYVILTALIWHATLQNTKATRQILESSHRPYLGVSSVGLRHENLLHSAVVVTIQNVGSVPSQRVEVDLNISLAGNTSSTFDGSAHSAIALMPGQSFCLAQDLTETEVQCLQGGGFKVEIQIRYQGATNKEYRTTGTYACKGIAEFVMVSGEMQ